MNATISSVAGLILFVACWGLVAPDFASAAEVPADRVVVMYFHRTQRCPTCLKMGSYSEEAVTTAFAQELKSGRVSFHYVDFQDPRNLAATKAYGINGPALIVAKVKANRVQEFKNLVEIWQHIREKPAFFKYVQDNIRAYLRAEVGTIRQ